MTALKAALLRTPLGPLARALRHLPSLWPLLRALWLIRRSTVEQLREPAYVRGILEGAGLRAETRDVYGDDAIYVNDGPGLWQIPDQLARCMCELSRHRIRTMIEIGTADGWTTTLMTAYLKRFNPGLRAITVDVADAFVAYPLIRPLVPLRAARGATSEAFAGRRFDLCFIDGDHSYGWVAKDYENVGRYAAICMFHDINDEIVAGHPQNAGGVPAFWSRLKEGAQARRVLEFTAHTQQRRVMGIGLYLADPDGSQASQ